MSKIKLYLDFDNTLVDSISAFCKVYSYKYRLHKDFIEPVPSLVKQWNFKDQCPLLQEEEVQDIFSSNDLFEYLKPIEDVKRVLLELQFKEFQLIVVSIGTYENISLKSTYISENFPFINDSILIVNGDGNMDKSIIKDGFLIDDNENNLFTSKAEIKICYGRQAEWNQNWKGLRCENWLEIKKLLLGGE